MILKSLHIIVPKVHRFISHAAPCPTFNYISSQLRLANVNFRGSSTPIAGLLKFAQDRQIFTQSLQKEVW